MKSVTIAPRQYLFYGILAIPLAFGALPLYMHIPKLYAESGLLSLTSIGIILSSVRFLDALTDPFFGRMADTINRRKLLIWGLVLFCLGFLAIAHPPTHINNWQLAAWLALTLSVTGISLSTASIALHAWGANLGENSQQRSLFVMSRESLTLVALIIAAALPVLVSNSLTTGVKILSYLLLTLSIIALILAFFIPLTKTLPNQHKPIKHNRLKHHMKDLASQFATLWQHKTSRWLLIIFMLNGIASAIPATVFFFFVEDVLDVKNQAGLFLATYFLSGALFMPIWNIAAKHYGRVRTWQASMLLAISAFMLAGILNTGDSGAFYVVCFASGLALGADLTLPASMAADYGEKTQKSGVLFGWWNFITKLNLALAAGIALPILSFMGYTTGAGEANSFALKTTYVLLPVLLKIITLILLSQQKSNFESINFFSKESNHETSTI